MANSTFPVYYLVLKPTRYGIIVDGFHGKDIDLKPGVRMQSKIDEHAKISSLTVGPTLEKRAMLKVRSVWNIPQLFRIAPGVSDKDLAGYFMLVLPEIERKPSFMIHVDAMSSAYPHRKLKSPKLDSPDGKVAEKAPLHKARGRGLQVARATRSLGEPSGVDSGFLKKLEAFETAKKERMKNENKNPHLRPEADCQSDDDIWDYGYRNQKSSYDDESSDSAGKGDSFNEEDDDAVKTGKTADDPNVKENETQETTVNASGTPSEPSTSSTSKNNSTNSDTLINPCTSSTSKGAGIKLSEEEHAALSARKVKKGSRSGSKHSSDTQPSLYAPPSSCVLDKQEGAVPIGNEYEDSGSSDEADQAGKHLPKNFSDIPDDIPQFDSCKAHNETDEYGSDDTEAFVGFINP